MEGAKGGSKRRKQHLQEATTTVNGDSANGKQAGGSDVVCVSTIAGSGKHQVQPPMVHFEKLLEEACPNHAYPIKNKLRNCEMMKNFMALGSLT
jgi:hypothetical protein